MTDLEVQTREKGNWKQEGTTRPGECRGAKGLAITRQVESRCSKKTK